MARRVLRLLATGFRRNISELMLKGGAVGYVDLPSEARKPLHGYTDLDKEHGGRPLRSPFSTPDSGEGAA